MRMCSLHGSDQVSGIDPVFMVWRSIKGACRLSVAQIPVAYEYADMFPKNLPGLSPSHEINFMIELCLQFLVGLQMTAQQLVIACERLKIRG